MIAWIDGRVMPADEARVSILDHGFLYGDSVYEAVRTFGGRPFRLGAHLARLERSAAGLFIRMPEGIEAAVDDVLRAGHGEQLVRIMVTRGVGSLGYDLDPEQTPTLVLLGMPVPKYPARFYDEGVRLATTDIRRNPQNSLDPSLKTSNLLNLRLAFMDARRQGADDVVMLNHRGEVAEASGSNIFLVKDGALQTPEMGAGILGGITRDFVIRLARDNGFQVTEGVISPEALRAADEVFLTSTTRSIMPATVLDSIPVGGGLPGALTRSLMESFEARVGAPIR
ncbi:MAG: branched-chain-amino acid aminotransferase [Armatimonadetes bacterium]|nr:branched-chain-amino acid aminotransferase [Armatimonadota bacterium]